MMEYVLKKINASKLSFEKINYKSNVWWYFEKILSMYLHFAFKRFNEHFYKIFSSFEHFFTFYR